MTRLKFFIVAWLVYIGLCLMIGPLVSGLVVLLPEEEPCEPWFE